MDRGMSAIFLVGEHLPRRAQRTLENDRRVEAHVQAPLLSGIATRPNPPGYGREGRGSEGWAQYCRGSGNISSRTRQRTLTLLRASGPIKMSDRCLTRPIR